MFIHIYKSLSYLQGFSFTKGESSPGLLSRVESRNNHFSLTLALSTNYWAHAFLSSD